MDPSQSPSLIRRLPILEPHVIGVLCGITAALAYTASNICLRSVSHCDPIFVSLMKAVPMVSIMGPAVLWRIIKGQGALTSSKAVGLLIAAGVVGQLGGNVVFQWSLGIVGMGLTVALCFGTMISSAAFLGWFLLKEKVTQRMIVASVVLIIAIAVLSLGASAAKQSVVGAEANVVLQSWWLFAAGILAPCIAGMAYAVLNVAIRYNGQMGTPLVTMLTVVGIVGVCLLGSISLWRVGWEAMYHTPQSDLLFMLGAGCWNVVAFGTLAKALHLTSVILANALNASQTAMAALAGIVFFGEAVTFSLMVGVLLTMLGLLLMKGRSKSKTVSAVEEVPLSADGMPVAELTMEKPAESTVSKASTAPQSKTSELSAKSVSASTEKC